MIVVRFTSEAMHVEGHATRGKKARLQVCAAVSTLMIGLQFYLREKQPLGVVPFSAWGSEATFVLLALCKLAIDHPGNVRVRSLPKWLSRDLLHLPKR